MIEFSADEKEYLVPGTAGIIQCKARVGATEKYAEDAPIAVICHPHPLYSGTMDNKVVTTLARVFRSRGLNHLRFNFRGVGKSEGKHDDMRGESDDLDLLLNLIAQDRPGQKFILAGFSFGSGVSSTVAARRQDVVHLVLVAPPVGKYESAYHSQYSCPLSVYQGGADDVVDPKLVIGWSDRIESASKLYWFEDVGHFFHGKLPELSAQVNIALDSKIGTKKEINR
jgi:alpha/beta superfamily hydrolase